MKKTIVVVMMLVVCNVCLAGDPNSMDPKSVDEQMQVTFVVRPTQVAPMTVQTELEEGADFGYVKIEFYVHRSAIDFTGKPGFLEFATQYWLRPFEARARQYRVSVMTEIHIGKSLAALEALAAAAKVK